MSPQGIPQDPYAELPAYAARVTWFLKIGNDEVVTDANRADVMFQALGPEEVPFLFRRDGIIIFEFQHSDGYRGGSVPSFEVSPEGDRPSETNALIEERERIRERRYRYMNAYMTCFNSVINMSNPLPRASGPDHYLWARQVGSQWTLRDNGACELHKVPVASAISIDQMRESVIRFASGRQEHYDLSVDILDLVYRLSYHLNNHEFQTSLILCWAVIEQCQNILWSDFIKGGYKNINACSSITGDRKKLLLTDRNFTASIRSQMLALAGIYRDQELKYLDRVRKKRNAFMHGLERISLSDAMFAHYPVEMVVERALGIKIGMFGNPGSWDYSG